MPNKFLIDKRKAHLSNLIFSRQLSRNKALQILEHPTYSESLQRQDFEFVAKKLSFTPFEFEQILNQKNIDHKFYGTEQRKVEVTQKILKIIRPITSKLKH